MSTRTIGIKYSLELNTGTLITPYKAATTISTKGPDLFFMLAGPRSTGIGRVTHVHQEPVGQKVRDKHAYIIIPWWVFNSRTFFCLKGWFAGGRFPYHPLWFAVTLTLTETSALLAIF